MMGGRFKNTTLVTVCAFVTIFLYLGMMSSMPLVISQDKNPPRDNLDEGMLVLLREVG
jgi:hypothetical protein